MRAAGGFGDPERWQHEWERSYTRPEWLDQLTASGGLTPLPADRRAQVLAAVGTELDAIGTPIGVHLITVAIMAMRTGADSV